MSSVTRPRGPLPTRVYWTRRTLVVVVALALVFGVARLLGGSGGSGNGPSAQPVGADASTTPATSAATSSAPTAPLPAATAPTVASSPSDTASPTKGTKGTKHKSAASTPLPASTGPCASDDIVATPTIKDKAYAGKPVVFAMSLTTKTAEACDFDVTASSLVVKVTSGSDRIWSTQDCKGAVPKESVVVRKDTPAVVDVAWTGRRSDTTCSRTPTWAEPGWYHAIAAAYGSDPVDEQFALLRPVRPTVTAAPKPDRKKSATSSSSPTTKKRQR